MTAMAFQSRGVIAWGLGSFDRIGIELDDAVEGNPTLVTSDEVDSVLAEGCAEGLPLCQCGMDGNGIRFRRFELPGTSPDEQFRKFQALKLTLRFRDGTTSTARIVVGDSLYHTVFHSDQSDGSKAASDSDWVHPLEEVVDGHIDFVNECFADHAPRWMTWEGSIGSKSIRSIDTALSIWRGGRSTSEPRLSLIVKLAEDLPRLLTAVCERPRVILTRVREMLPAGRVQQVDAACLRWLARQPGRTVAEKAGPSQHILAVHRREQTDTHENRVVKDLLVRGIRAADRYVREHLWALDHLRVRRVIRFRGQLKRLLRESSIASVHSLSGRPQPNYVLQHDSRYRPLWEAYIQLVRQQMLQDQVWMWRARLWREHCTIGLFDALDTLGVPGSAQRSDLVLNLEQMNGVFVDSRAAMPAWRLRRNDSTVPVEVVSRLGLMHYPGCDPRLQQLNPDIALIHRDAVSTSMGLLFCVCVASDSISHQKLINELRALVESSGIAARCLLLLPAESISVGGGFRNAEGNRIRSLVYRVEKRGREELAEAIRWLLDL